jgi:hypothetical protein
MHKIKQTIFISPDEVKEYELSPNMASNPIYITEGDRFLVPRYGSDLYYEVTENKREILAIRDLISRNTITLEVKKDVVDSTVKTYPPPPPPEREVRKTFLSW